LLAKFKNTVFDCIIAGLYWSVQIAEMSQLSQGLL